MSNSRLCLLSLVTLGQHCSTYNKLNVTIDTSSEYVDIFCLVYSSLIRVS